MVQFLKLSNKYQIRKVKLTNKVYLRVFKINFFDKKESHFLLKKIKCLLVIIKFS